MEQVVIYHNGRCSKSRGALEILQEKKVPHTIRWYLTEPLSVGELHRLLTKLQMKPVDLIRKNEALYKEQFKGNDYTDEEWIQILADHPILIERPVVEKGARAIVARPPEKVFELIG